ncbi:MAG: hypothetical protein CM15mV4_2650 [Caudoviricetes sp.]|nr:MAG: hypothetical protein CM15mV4_2650 [Caudoviricetes sp.]
MVDSLEREFPRNIQRHILEMHHNTLGVGLLLLALNITMMVKVICYCSGASESITTNPPEDTALFTVAGTTGDPTSSRIMLDLVPTVDSLVHVSRKLHRQMRWVEPSHSVVMLYSMLSTQYLLVETSLHSVVLQKELQAILQKILHSLLLEEPKTKHSVQHLTSDQVLQVYLDSIEKHTERYVGDVAEFAFGGTVLRVFFLRNNIGSGSIFVAGDGVENIQNVILDLEIYLLLVVLLRLSQQSTRKHSPLHCYWSIYRETYRTLCWFWICNSIWICC